MFRKQIIQQLLLILLINNYQDFLNQCCTVSICKTGWFCVSSSNVSHLTVSELHENEFVYRSQRWKVKILLCFWNNLCTLTAQKQHERMCAGCFYNTHWPWNTPTFLKLICDGSMKVFFLNLIKDTSWSTWNLKTQELSTTSQPNLNTEQQPCSHTVPAIKTCLCKWLEMMYKVLSFGLGAPRDTKTLGTFSFFKTMQ